MINKQTLTSCYLAVFAFFACVASLPASSEPFIVKDGRPQADIVISDKPTRAVKLAANELALHIFKMSGAQLPVVTGPGKDFKTHIYVGRSPWADKLGINFADLTNDMFKVVSGEGYLALVGHDTDFQPTEPWCKSAGDRPRMQADWEKRTGRTWLTMNLSGFKNYNNDLDIWMNDGAGSLYAVYDFLRALGVEWYMPGELGEIIPKQADIMVPEVNKTAAPEVRGRSISFVNFFASGVTNDALWYFRLGLNGGSQGGFHTMYVILSDPNTRTNHPEYYALYNGKRDLYSRGGKPCLSSEGFFSNMVEYARAHFDVYPQADEFTVMPGDGYTIMCQCDLCKGKDTPERGWEGTISDYVWGFVNRVAGEIQKSHPGRKIHCAAYGTYLLPPEKIQLHTNITVRIVAPTLGAFSGDPARRPHVIAIRNAWLAKLPPGSMLSAHEQNIQNQPGRKGEGLPIFFMREIAEDLKSWNGKLLGENVEVWQTGGGIGGPGLNHLHYYLTGRLYWDSKQELDRLLGDYYSRFFGSAREEMKSFYERAEKTCMRFEAPDIEYLLATLKAAEDKAGTNTVYGRRVALIRGECEPKLRELLLQRNSKEEYARLEISPQTVENISVDGQLNEAFWSGLSNNPLRDAVSGGAPKFSTSFRIGSDGANLCIGVRCLEPDMQSLIEAGQKRDDMNVWMDDAVEVILKTPRRSFYQFAINPKGALVDLDRSQGMQGIVWDANVAAATARGTNEWTVELTIPFKDILGDKPTAEQPWHINICRNRPRDKNTELSIFVPSGKPTFQNTEKMAVLVVKEPAGEE